MSENSKAIQLAEDLEQNRAESLDRYEIAAELRRLVGELNAQRAIVQGLESGKPAQVPDGWQLVPVEPDSYMRSALASPEATELEWWAKILAVAPAAPQPPVDLASEVIRLEKENKQLRDESAKYFGWFNDAAQKRHQVAAPQPPAQVPDGLYIEMANRLDKTLGSFADSMPAQAYREIESVRAILATAPQPPAQEPVKQAKAPTWYSRDEIVRSLERMNYHPTASNELADWFLRHIQLAFNRGFYQAHGPASVTQLEELELWHLLECATGALTRKAAPHSWERTAWTAGHDFIVNRRKKLATASAPQPASEPKYCGKAIPLRYGSSYCGNNRGATPDQCDECAALRKGGE
ncbi:hypothetical protein [Chitinibacter tainanensis]|uniref:hypothetical protein n=1 Tax=Chitinibacter tainanensis TaxID=230667 RepID=UPI0023536526|nr:hypothetical protein [Chitinibacter tainanensis]